MTLRILCVLSVLCAAFTIAQTYKCDWSVNGIGGGEMVGSAYKCGATVGQTAAGPITGANYWALIGFWQPEGQTGVREAQWSSGQVLKTRLYAPQPNPSRAAALRYTLAVAGNVSLSVHDLTGRQVRVLVNSQQKPGRYTVKWNGCDHLGRSLANGVYFVRMTAGDYRATEKVVLQR
jgi:FlgD Ig-like domain